MDQFIPRTQYACQSVVGGWQTIDQWTHELIGPAFHDVRDLWTWQQANLDL